MSESKSVEVVVIGAGPAGLALSYELSMRGVDVRCVAPTLSPWAPVYGAWCDELPGLDVPLLAEWDRARVSFPRRESLDLDRRYARLDSAALFARWSSRLVACDQFIPGVVASTLFSPDFAETRLDSGLVIRSHQVFDASGHRPRSVVRNPKCQGFQSAFGRDVARKDDTLGEGTMGLMLWDDVPMSAPGGVRRPLFDYVMPLSEKIAFEERTVLASRELIAPDAIAAHMSPDFSSSATQGPEFERCIIPMGHDIPSLEQQCVGFGAAASMVHPATGYMVARVLRTAPRLADAYVASRTLSAAHAARALWDVVWPTQRVRTHELYQFGLEALLRLDVRETWDFFEAFFQLPDELWRPYQSGTATTNEVAAAMQRVFAGVDNGIRAKLVSTAFSRHVGRLLRLMY